MSQRIVIIPGDGIGRDVVAEVIPVLKALGGLELEQLPWSADYYLQTGVTIPPDGRHLRSLMRCIGASVIRGAGNRHARDVASARVSSSIST